MNKSLSSSSPSKDPPSNGIVVNGALNNAAFASNVAIPTTTNTLDLSPPLESQTTDSSTFESAPRLPDTHTTTATEEDQPSAAHPESALAVPSEILSSADAAIVTALQDTTIVSSLPPAVEATESAIRETPLDLPEVTEGTESHIRDTSLDLLLESAALPTSPLAHPTESAIEPEQVSDLPLQTSLQTEQSSASNLTDSAQPLPQIDEPSDALQSSISQEPTTQDPSSSGPAPDLKAEPQPDTKMEATEDTASAQQDTVMMDAPQPPLTSTKNSRDREDDEDDERSVKRTKIAENASAASGATNGVAVPSAPSQEAPNPTPEHNQEPGRQITKYVEKELIKHLKNAARTTDGKHFKEPVSVLWPAFAESYNAKIENPIDFSSIETKIRAGRYPSMNEVRDDLRLLRANAITFNGVDNPIAQSAVRATRAVLDKIDSIPADPPSVAKVIQKKSKAATPIGDAAARAPAGRRHSRGGGQPTDPVPAPTYALNPQSNTPLIRRDSTKDDGRPKRDIHPPKNKDLPYTTRPKSKKHVPELSWCQEVMTEINKAKYADFVYPFKEPVDPVAQGIPTYFSIVRTPMDLSTVQTKLDNGHYTTSKDFEKDINQIYTNCYKFNPAGNPVNECGKKLESLWKEQLAKKGRWMSDHAPATAAASTSPTPDSEEEASDDEQPQQDAATTNTGTAATKRLVEEQDKLITLISTPGADPAVVEMQRQMITFLKAQVDKETVAPATSTQITKKSKKAKPAAPRAAVPAQQAPKKKTTVAAAPVKKTANTSHKAAKKEKYMGTIEKEVISAGIATLPDAVSAQVLKLIQDGQPEIDEGDDGTVELDIDAIPIATLWKIYDLIKTHTPDIERELRRQFSERDAPRAQAKQAPKKKNKPMNKFEQDRKIEQLKNQMQTFERGNSNSQEPPLPCKFIQCCEHA